MRRAIFANTDAVMREYISHRDPHQGSQTNHRFRVIAEYEECADIRTQTTMQRDAIGNCCHGQLADTKVQVAARIVILAEVTLIVHVRLVGRREIRTAADQLRHDILQTIDHRSGQSTRCLCFIFIRPELFVCHQCICINRCMEFLPTSFLCREFLAILSKQLVPLSLSSLTLLRQLLIMIIDSLRNVEGLLRLRPAQVLLESLDVFFPQRLTMCTGFALLSRAAITDLGLDRDEGRMLLISLGCFDCLADCFQIIAIFDRDRLETECSHTGLDILGKSDIRAALDRNLVRIIEHDKLGQAKRASQREGFRRNTFHHAAITAQSEGIVIYYIIARLVERSSQMSLSHSHADSHAHACTQRAGRSFDTSRMTILRMTRRQGSILTELFHVVHSQSIAIEMKQGIQQRRTMTTRQDEAVAVGPLRILSIMIHMIAPQLISHGCTA